MFGVESDTDDSGTGSEEEAQDDATQQQHEVEKIGSYNAIQKTYEIKWKGFDKTTESTIAQLWGAAEFVKEFWHSDVGLKKYERLRKGKGMTTLQHSLQHIEDAATMKAQKTEIVMIR